MQILPLGNVRHFRRIHKNDTLFLKMCVFRGKLVNNLEHPQILPLGNVRHFRRIRKNDVPFLKTCVFFAEIGNFRRNLVIFVKKNTIFKKKMLNFLKLILENRRGPVYPR